MKKITTDSDLVKVAWQIDGHLDAIRGLIADLEEAKYPTSPRFPLLSLYVGFDMTDPVRGQQQLKKFILRIKEERS